MRSFGVLVLLCGCATSSRESAQTPETCAHEHKGRVTVSVDQEPVLSSRVVATFADTEVSSRAPTCTVTTVGACTVTECQTENPAGTSCLAGARTTAAGTIGVSGGASPAIALSSDKTRGYAGVTSPGARWIAGDALHVDAAGGEVAAFAADLVFPSRVEITGPADYVAKKSPISLDWKSGIPLTWKPGTGKVWLHLIQGDVDVRKRTEIECEADAASGAFTMPPEALEHLEGTRMTDSANATLEIAGRAHVDITSGDYAISVEALSREEPRSLVVLLAGVPVK
jgi:hypothetical protein